MFDSITKRRRGSPAKLAVVVGLALAALSAEVWVLHVAVARPLEDAIARLRSRRFEPGAIETGFVEEITIVAPRRPARPGTLLEQDLTDEAAVVPAGSTASCGPCEGR